MSGYHSDVISSFRGAPQGDVMCELQGKRWGMYRDSLLYLQIFFKDKKFILKKVAGRTWLLGPDFPVPDLKNEIKYFKH